MIDWRTDEEENWERWEQISSPATTNSSWPVWVRQHWRILIALIFFLTAVITLISWQLQAQINQTVVSFKADIQQTDQTVWQTAVSDDLDLFTLFVSPKNRRWALIQRILIREHLFIDRAPIGLWLDKSSISTAPTVRLSPDFQTAKVQTERPYLTQNQDGTLSTVILRQTAVYQQNRTATAWQLTAPQNYPDFWGRTLINNGGTNMQIIYPDRDKIIGRQLLADLDNLLTQLCQDPDLTCPNPLNFRLYLSPENDSLLLLTRNLRQLQIRTYNSKPRPYNFKLTLPTPTLIGLPIDDAGYNALYRGYAAWIATSFINSTSKQPLAHQTVVQKLASYNLLPPPVTGYHPVAQPAPIPLPTQTITLICQENGQPSSSWKYQPNSASWLQDANLTTNLATNPALDPFQPTPSTPLTAERIRQEIPLNQRPDALTILQIIEHPTSPTQQLILAEETSEATTIYLFWIDKAVPSIQFIDRLLKLGELQEIEPLRQNGRFLTLVYVNRPQTHITLYDLEKKQAKTVTIDGGRWGNGRYGWSADEQWLFTIKDRALTLIAPATSYQTIIYHNIGGCLNAFWQQP